MKNINTIAALRQIKNTTNPNEVHLGFEKLGVHRFTNQAGWAFRKHGWQLDQNIEFVFYANPKMIAYWGHCPVYREACDIRSKKEFFALNHELCLMIVTRTKQHRFKAHEVAIKLNKPHTKFEPVGKDKGSEVYKAFCKQWKNFGILINLAVHGKLDDLMLSKESYGPKLLKVEAPQAQSSQPALDFNAPLSEQIR